MGGTNERRPVARPGGGRAAADRGASLNGFLTRMTRWPDDNDAYLGVEPGTQPPDPTAGGLRRHAGAGTVTRRAGVDSRRGGLPGVPLALLADFW